MKSAMPHHSRFPVFHLFFLLLGGLALHAADVLDPFASGASSWTDQIAAQKPYRLQIACAEMSSFEPSASSSAKSDHSTKAVTEEFLKTAKITTIAVGTNDLGKIIREDGVEIAYKITRKGTEFALSFNLKSKGAEGGREINTDLVLTESAWIRMGGLEREQVTTLKNGTTTRTSLSFIVALRIDAAMP
jgi:hypothetical protein